MNTAIDLNRELLEESSVFLAHCTWEFVVAGNEKRWYRCRLQEVESNYQGKTEVLKWCPDPSYTLCQDCCLTFCLTETKLLG